MLKRLLTILTVSFSFFLFSNLAWSSVSETTWDIGGAMKVRVSIQGLGSQMEAIDFSDEISFHSDGTFEMIDWEGNWKQIRNRITINLDPADVEAYFEEFLASNELDVTVEITKLSLTGTELKNGTINGRILLNMDFHLNDLGLDGKLSVTATFTGTLITGDQVSSDEASASPLRLKSFNRIVQKKLSDAIKGPALRPGDGMTGTIPFSLGKYAIKRVK
jgi:hypothetical protein